MSRKHFALGILLLLGAAAALGGVHFIVELVSAADIRQAAQMTGGDPGRGRVLLNRYGCGTCHTIPGVAEARGHVGPPLGGFSHRVYVAGVAVNSAEDAIAWIRDPPALSPRTAMPALGVPEQAARDMTAYLYSIK